MQLEIEQKFPVKDLPALRERLEGLGARFTAPLEQVDIYFAHPVKNFAQTDEALRLRKVGSENCITYKGPKLDQQTKTRREIELPIPPGESGLGAFAELLEILGFRQVAEVRKRREPGLIEWEEEEVHLALDEVAGLGTYVELEIVAAPEQLEGAKAALAALAKELELTGSERRGYLDLLLSGKP